MRRNELPEEESDVNLTPMLDVVFILLIFFIVTASFVKVPGIEVDKVPLKTIEDIDAPIMVAISAKDEVWIDRRPVEFEQVFGIIQRMVRDAGGTRAIIQVDGESSNGLLMDLMSQMQNAGVEKIDVSTEER